MEPVAHFGIRKNEEIEYIQINWTEGQKSKYKIEKLNHQYVFNQGKTNWYDSVYFHFFYHVCNDPPNKLRRVSKFW